MPSNNENAYYYDKLMLIFVTNLSAFFVDMKSFLLIFSVIL
jgi:hypothetical protein